MRAKTPPTAPAPTPGPKERILRAAIVCIERDGLDRASVRRIALEAGANVAAISYHFGSKDQLIAEVRAHTLRGALSQAITDLDALIAEGLPVRRALPRWLDDYLADAVRWPRITYLHLRDVLVEQDYRSVAARELDRFLDELLERVSPVATRLDAGRKRIVLAQIWSNVVLLMLMPRLLAPFARLDLSSAGDRRAYVRTLLAPLLGA
jgi:AcrR family transcriptional regulator